MNTRWLGRLLARVHRSEDGSVSLETVLILGAIALPVLIFLIKWGWPTVRSYFERGMNDLMAGSDAAKDSGGTTTTGTTSTDPAAATTTAPATDPTIP